MARGRYDVAVGSAAACGGGGGSRHELAQLPLELAAKQAVDDEVRRRVDGDDEVTDVVEPHVQRTGRLRAIVHDIVQNLRHTPIAMNIL